MIAPCPCGSGARYLACCGRWHAGAGYLQAPDAEALMRSRYSAFVLGLDDYLLATWHPRTRPAGALTADLGVRWLSLEIKRHTPLGDDEAQVEFVARSKHGGRARRLHETSRFVREGGCWFYLDGELY
jgi:SEC-C motif domain protein